MMESLAVIGAATTAAYFLTNQVRRYALAAELLDIPNARSSHNAPTPRGGGLAVVVVVLTILPLLVFLVPLSYADLIGLWVGGAAVAVIGWLDDRADLRVRWRLLVHLVAAIWAVAWAGGVPALALPGIEWEWGWLGVAVLVLFISWMLNLYNFMDGIDGMAGVEAVTVSGAAAILLWWLDADGWALVTSLVGAASLGFLFWNWPPAKIFMGDAGSGFLGFILATLAVMTWVEVGLTIWFWIIILGAFIVDATITLFRRIMNRERFYEAHHSHAYQHAVRHYGSHLPVTIAVGVINLLWLFPLALAAALWPEWGLLILAIAWWPIVVVCLHFRAGYS